MKKSTFSALAAVAFTIGSVLPACADEPMSMLKNTAMFPVRALGVGSGIVVGTPVAVTRRVSNRCIGYTQTFADKIGGKDSLPPVLFASVLGVPFGVLAGSAEGVYFGGKNGIVHGSEKPFSKESFSLGEELE